MGGSEFRIPVNLRHNSCESTTVQPKCPSIVHPTFSECFNMILLARRATIQNENFFMFNAVSVLRRLG